MKTLVVWTALGTLAVTGCLAMVDFEESCSTDSDCGAGRFCRASRCTDTCDESSDCGTGRQCDPDTKKCREVPQCTSNNASALCGNYACNSASHVCYADCRGPNLQSADEQCGASTVCTYDFTCRPPCSVTYDPACAPFLCDTIMGWCSDYCIEQVDCADGYRCVSGTCTD